MVLRPIILGIGGSATNNIGGTGMLVQLRVKFTDVNGDLSKK